MKLMCQMNGPMGVGFSMPSRSAVEHDALAAHALLQAIDDAEDGWFLTQKEHTDWIKKKADKLMRKWTNQSEV